jgi:hypothetical protein
MIDVKEARNILGKKAKGFSDEKVKSILEFLYLVCEKIVDSLKH